MITTYSAQARQTKNPINQNQTCRSSASPPPIREAASVLFSCYKAEYLWELPVPFPMRAQSFLHGCPHGRHCINCSDGYKPFFWIYAMFPRFGQ